MKTTTRFIAAVALLAASCFAHAEVVVVVAAKSPVTSLTSDQVSQIFLGKLSTLPNGSAAVPLDQAEGVATRNDFYAKVTGKDATQIKSYRAKLIFSGRGQPPKEVADNAEMKKQLAGNPGGIGYIDKSAVDSSVKVVLTP